MSLLRKGAYVPGTTQNITTSGTSQASSAVGASTAIVRIAVNADTYIAVGSAPTATTSSMLIPSGGTEFIAVNKGTDKIAVLQVSASGIASITELQN
jgi:hypothetical protein